MARLTQQNSVAPQNTSVSVPQTTQAAVPQRSVKRGVTRVAKKSFRRYPRWFLPVLSLAILLTLGQLGYRATLEGTELARAHGWQPRVKHALVMPSIGAAQYAVSPQGDKYLIGDSREAQAQLELYASSGKLLWKRQMPLDTLAFSQDGTQIFNGTEVLDAATGKVIALAPVKQFRYRIAWASNGSKAAWRIEYGIQVWDRATNKTELIALKDYTVSNARPRLSPDGKWLATLVYDTRYGSHVAFWNLTKSTPPSLYQVDTPNGGAFGLAFSPDSRRLLYAGKSALSLENHNLVSIWTLDNRQSTVEFSPLYLPIGAVWSPDGKTFALRGQNEWSLHDSTFGYRLWSANYGTNILLNDFYFTKDNRLYYYDYTQKRWSLEYWDLATTLKTWSGN